MVGVAQLVERRTVAPNVVGSNPISHPRFQNSAASGENCTPNVRKTPNVLEETSRVTWSLESEAEPNIQLDYVHSAYPPVRESDGEHFRVLRWSLVRGAQRGPLF